MTTRTWLTLTAAYALLAAGPALAGEAHEGSAEATGHCACSGHPKAMDHGAAVDHGAAMNHGAMNCGAMNHGAMNHGAMNHGAMNCGAAMDAAAQPQPTKLAAAPAAARTIAVQVTAEFSPAEIHVKRGEAVKLVFTRTTDRTCATSVHFRDLGVEKELPLGKPVTIALKPSKAGTHRFSCGMDMVAGTLVVD